MDLNFIEMLILILVLFLSANVYKLQGQIKGLKYSLDQISKQMDLPNDPANKEVQTLIDTGEDIKAVKRSREIFGFTLLEGKEYVEALKGEDI